MYKFNVVYYKLAFTFSFKVTFGVIILFYLILPTLLSSVIFFYIYMNINSVNLHQFIYTLKLGANKKANTK